MNNFLEKYAQYIDRYTSHITGEEEAECVINDFISLMNNNMNKIIIYGAGCVGRNIVRLFKEMGIHIDRVVDKRWNIVGECCGVTVDNPEVLLNDVSIKYIVLACEREIASEMKKDAQSIGINNCEYVCGHDLNILLQSSWCMKKAYNRSVKSINDCYECPVLDNTCNSLCCFYKNASGFSQEDEIGTDSVNMIGYLLSNICTLKCKNCCESVPYMPKETRKFIAGDVVVKDIVKMAKAVKYLTLVEFIGGEPFLNPDLVYIIREIKKVKNIGMLHFFTNGTVVPSDELCDELKDYRITVYMSNYQVSYPERFRELVNETANKLEWWGVQFYFGKKTNWNDFHNYDECCTDHEVLLKKYPECFLHNCNRLMEGKLYICPHQYAGIKLGKLKDINTVNIHDYSNEELISELEKFKAYKYIDACKHCSMPYDAPVVPSGEQLD